MVSSGRLDHIKGKHGQGLEISAAAEAVKQKVVASAAPIVDAPPSDTSFGGEDDIVDIGLDGSVVEYYPGFEKYMREALRDIPEIGPEGEKKIRIGIAKDGSGVGAALIALVAGK